jgi:flagellar biosynthesis/type III secretory pathway chaperone
MPPRDSGDVPASVRSLIALLGQHLEVHAAMLDCIDRKRQAIRQADLAMVNAISQQESPLLSRLTDLEQKRAGLIRRLTGLLSPGAKAAMTVRQIAAAIEPARAKELLAVADELKALAQKVQRANSIVRDAAETLARHMAGVMQTVGSALSAARVYGRRGQVALGAQMHYSVDMKS